MVLALRCKDGVVLATDGKVTRASISYRAVARIWQRTNKVHPVPPRVLLAGAGEVALIHTVAEALAEADASKRQAGIAGLLETARATLVRERAEAIARYTSIYGAGGAAEAPKAVFILVEADPEPRIVYLAEDGDVEDQTHLGYAATGSGDLIVHVRMQPYDPRELTVEQGAVLAFGLIKDTIDSGTFRVSDPVQLWSIRPGQAPEEWNDARLAKTEEKYHAFRKKVHDALRSL